ncbi:MAG: 50S ribosomal protein L5 [Candidatus Aenigmarchaeota archaeon]|nr:50S ribosomal protein L5 [Candidatus Aenigmarchaeota archaeon]
MKTKNSKTESDQNPMKQIRVEKVTLNMGAGEPGPKLNAAKKTLEIITGKKITITKSKKRSTFGVTKGREIGAMVTLRGKDACDILKRLLESLENKINPNNFDVNGNFSFGIQEYINIPGAKYDPEVGILGLDVAITLERPGFRIKRRKNPDKIGKSHMIAKEDAMKFIKKEFGTKIEEDE